MAANYDIEDNPLIELAINAALTTQDIVAAPGAEFRIVVFGYWFQAASAVTAKWAYGTVPTDFFPAISLTAGQMMTEKVGRRAALVCPKNSVLRLVLSGTVQCSGMLYYQLTRKDV